MKRVGAYELLKPLATGGMAEVFLARSSSSYNNGKIFALKRTLPDYLDSPEMAQMFLEEIRVGASLNHSNIVQVCDFGMTDNQAFLVMEFIHGVPVRELIATLRDKGDTLPLPFILYIVKKVADALEYAHNAPDPATGEPMHLIHRDISPQNVMVTFEGEVKVIDFGIAKAAAVSGNTQHGTVKGKLAYMSPEQILRETVDHRSDLFSLGIIFWELLANRRFFAGRTPAEVKKMVREYRYQNLNLAENENLESLEPVLSRLLHHDKSKRYGRAKDFCADLQLILNRSFPAFSPLEFAVYLKSLFFEKYDKSLREVKALLAPVAEHTRTDANMDLTVPEKTVVTYSKIVAPPLDFKKDSTAPPVYHEPIMPNPVRHKPLIKPKMLGPRKTPKNIFQLHRMEMRKIAKKEGRIPFTTYILLLLGFGLFGYFGYHWQKKNDMQSLLLLPQMPKPFEAEFVDVVFTSPAGPSQVILNGQLQPSQTPMKLHLEKDRPYQIELSAPGHIPRHFSFTPVKSTEYSIKLEALPQVTAKRDFASLAVADAKAPPPKIVKAAASKPASRKVAQAKPKKVAKASTKAVPKASATSNKSPLKKKTP